MKRFVSCILSLLFMLTLIPSALAGGFEIKTYTELLEKLKEPGNQTLYIDQSLAPNGDFGWPAEPVILTVSKTLNPLTETWTVPENVTLRLEGNGQVTGGTLIMEGTLDISQPGRGSTFPVKNLNLYGRLIGKGKPLEIGTGSSVTINGGTLENFSQIDLLGTLAGSGVLEIPVKAEGLRQSENPPASTPVLDGSFTLTQRLTLGDTWNRRVNLTVTENSTVRCMGGVRIGENTTLILNGELEDFGRNPDIPADGWIADIEFVKNGKLNLGANGCLSLKDHHTAKCIAGSDQWESVTPTSSCVTGNGTIRCTHYYVSGNDNGYLLFGQLLTDPVDRTSLDGTYMDKSVKLDLRLLPMEKLLLEGLATPTHTVPADQSYHDELVNALNAEETTVSGLENMGSTGFIQDIAHESDVDQSSLKVQMSMTVESYDPAAGLTMELIPQVVLTKNGVSETRDFPAGSAKMDSQFVTLSVRLPQGMTEPNMVRHQLLGGGTELLPVSVSNGVATWNQSSFSPVTLFRDDRSITLTFPDVPESEKVQTYTSADVGKNFPAVATVEGQPRFGGWIFTLNGEWDKSYEQELTDDLLTRLCAAETVDVQWISPRENVYNFQKVTVKEGTPFPQGSFTLQVQLFSYNHFNIWDDLIVASYDRNGKLLKVKAVDAPKAWGDFSVEIPVSNQNGDVAKVKLFTLPRYGKTVPLSNTIELNAVP